MRSEFYKIKSIANIPKRYTVFCLVEDEYSDAADSGWVYMLALIDGEGERDDYIALYGIDQFGGGDVEAADRLVKLKYCSKCGKQMGMKYKVGIDPVEYFCECKDIPRDY